MDRASVTAAVDAWDAARSAIAALPFDAMGPTELLDFYERRQYAHREDAAIDHTVLTAARRLGPRCPFVGDRLEPEFTHTADALARGAIDPAHVEVIQKCLKELPGWVDESTRAEAEHDLAAAALGVVLATWAAPGQNLPDDPGVCETLRNDIAGSDGRTPEQRNHDALHTALNHVVGSGELGELNGVPATVIVTTTLADLETAAAAAELAEAPDGGVVITAADSVPGTAKTAGCRCVTSSGWQVGRTMHFGRARCCASVAQRLALYARDQGCTRPGCTVPPNRCQVHHAEQDWKSGLTNVDDMTLACRGDNNVVEQSSWSTRRRDGRTEWVPPPPLDTGQTRVNNHHHPHRYFTGRGDDEDEEPA